MIETRFSELRFDQAKRRVTGVVMKYGDPALIPAVDGSTWEERVLSGAFGDVTGKRISVVYQHDHNRPVAATLGGGAIIEDGPEVMKLSAVLGESRDAQDAYSNLKNGVFSGLSVRMLVKDHVIDRAARRRDVRRAELLHVGLVDSPAYESSLAEARSMFFNPEDRGQFSGNYKMDTAETISDQPGRAVVRKRKFRPAAFDKSISDIQQEIGLLTSRNPHDTVASKSSGTLVLERDGDSMLVTAANVADTAQWRDLLANVTLALP